jgi:hypothetical protein
MRSVARTRANHGLLNLFLTRGSRADQRAQIFSGIFAMVEAVGTLRINLFLRGNKYVNSPLLYFQGTVNGERSPETADAQSWQALSLMSAVSVSVILDGDIDEVELRLHRRFTPKGVRMEKKLPP